MMMEPEGSKGKVPGAVASGGSKARAEGAEPPAGAPASEEEGAAGAAGRAMGQWGVG